MSILLLLRGAATTPGVFDAGTSSENAVVSALTQSKSGADTGTGLDSSSVVKPVVATEQLPQVTLQVSFDAPAGPIYREAVLTAPAKVYYRLNETSGLALDSAGNLNLAVVGSVTRNQTTMVTGESTDKSYDFSGGHLRAIDNGLLDADELTFEALVSLDTLSGTRAIMQRITTLESVFDLWTWRFVDGKMQLVTVDPDDNYYVYWSTKIFSTSTVYHVMVIMRENQIEFYVDGVLTDFIPKSWVEMKKSVLPPPPSAPEGTPPTVFQTELIIGGGALVSGVVTDLFDGRIDEPAIYTFALPAEAALYHQIARSAPTAYTWTTISTDTNSQVKELSTQSGRQDIFREIETGLFTGMMENQDRAFDPSYTGSPYYPNLRPALPLRCTVSKNGISYDLFRGDVEDWPQDWQGRLNQVPITALDAFDVLAGATATVMNRPVELTGARIHAILDAAAWPRELRDIDQGTSLVQAWPLMSDDAKSLLNKITQAESGHLYIDGRGFVVFRSRMSRSNAPVSVTFSNRPTGAELPISDAKVVEDKDQIYNDVRVTITDRQTHVAQSADSVLKHRLRTLTLDIPLEDNTEGDIKAGWLLYLYKDPFKRIKEVIIEPQMDSNMWAHALGRKIGDRVRFKIYPPGPGTFTQLEAHIEYINHKYTYGRWQTLWRLSPADTSDYWILNTHNLDTGTRLAY